VIGGRGFINGMIRHSLIINQQRPHMPRTVKLQRADDRECGCETLLMYGLALGTDLSSIQGCTVEQVALGEHQVQRISRAAFLSALKVTSR
jgi:hypothetical protein